MAFASPVLWILSIVLPKWNLTVAANAGGEHCCWLQSAKRRGDKFKILKGVTLQQPTSATEGEGTDAAGEAKAGLNQGLDKVSFSSTCQRGLPKEARKLNNLL